MNLLVLSMRKNGQLNCHECNRWEDWRLSLTNAVPPQVALRTFCPGLIYVQNDQLLLAQEARNHPAGLMIRRTVAIFRPAQLPRKIFSHCGCPKAEAWTVIKASNACATVSLRCWFNGPLKSSSVRQQHSASQPRLRCFFPEVRLLIRIGTSWMERVTFSLSPVTALSCPIRSGSKSRGG